MLPAQISLRSMLHEASMCDCPMPAVQEHCAQQQHQSVSHLSQYHHKSATVPVDAQLPVTRNCRLSKQSNGFTERSLRCHGFSASSTLTSRPRSACRRVSQHQPWSSCTAVSSTSPCPICISHLLHAAPKGLMAAIRLASLHSVAAGGANRQILACAEASSRPQNLENMSVFQDIMAC